LNSKRRKNILRERRGMNSEGMTFRWLSGRETTANDWSFFYSCYRATIAEHGAIPYLNEAFFRLVGETMPDGVRLLVASQQGRDIAAAFFLLGSRSLFGRYWGAIDRIPNLHFETCFYQPIEYCIRNRLQRFEAGAQGEHKLNRGLIPTPALSMHWLNHPGFFDAVQRYTQAEWEHVEQYQTILHTHSPYRKEQ
jgi:predicted N-acyltransferase